jgi:hypothetical protein
MNTIRNALVLCALLGAAITAQAQVNIPNPQAPGNSPDSAVRILAANDLMAERQITRWIRAHYPDWDADQPEYHNIGMERYAVVYITSRDKPGRRLYFRVQSNPNDPNDDSSFPGM